MLPEIEGPIIAGLPQVKDAPKGTADRIVGAAQTYQRIDEQIAQTLSATELGAAPGGVGGTGGGSGGGAGSSGAVGAGVQSAAASAGSTGSAAASSASSGSGAM